MSEFPPLHDYSRSRAVVMGTWDYAAKGLLELPAARRSLDRMVGLLTGELCGWPEDRVTVLRNRAKPGSIPDELISLFSDVKDVALFYFVGHGQVDPDDQLCLGLTETVTVPARRASTSLKFDDVRKALVGSDAATKIVILDCCFAGLATRRDNTLAAHGVDVMDMTRATGAYTMAATRQFTTALFETDTPKPQTYFTKYLVDTVEAGIPSEQGGLKLHSLYGEVEEALVRDKRPTPENRVIDNARDFVFAHNVNPMPAPTPAVDEDDERDYLRRRLDELAETIKTIADAVTVRPPAEPVAPAEPVPAPVAPVVLVRTAPVAPEPVESTAAADAAAAEQESDQLRARISQLEKAVLTLKQAVPEEQSEVAAAADATVPPEAPEAVPPVAEPPVTEAPETAAPKPAVPKPAPPKAAATKAAQPTPTPTPTPPKTDPPPTAPTKTAAGGTPTAGPQPVKAVSMAEALKAAAAQSGTGGTPRSHPKQAKAAGRRKAQAKPNPQPKKTATSPGQAHPPNQPQPQPQPQPQTAAPMPGPRVAPAPTAGQKPLADFFADFADEVAAAAVDPGPESDLGPAPVSGAGAGAGAGTKTEEQATTTSGTRTDRTDRTQASDLDKFFELFTEEISRRRLGTTPDD